MQRVWTRRNNVHRSGLRNRSPLSSEELAGGSIARMAYWLEYWWMFPVALTICITV
jgi:hypothetical protein